MLSNKVDLPVPLSPVKIVTLLSRAIFCPASLTEGTLNGKGCCLEELKEKDRRKGITDNIEM
ncbi:hypothetical protein CCY01nite_44920 [Chitinophaga cymbidii]|uniref:Uncharacterized protein n=1 Tax=Chitinophaga cymbidii TaxID=1096750 RepID=A0A512RRB6_9BACT|nr:hypothetical protein CCY01nite_44920 [Chitinophaga cymbidii]